MGCGFTTPVDDGPHKPPSHPELLDRLSQEFVKSGYDVKRLIRWICDSEAYNLTSRAGKKNGVDDPSRGHVPLFSRMYPKPLEAEQLYDSLLMATRAENSGETNWAEAQKQRDAWLQQFIIAFGTDEVDEANTFNGTIPQALLMMNGPLVEKAVRAEKGSFLCSVLESDGEEARENRSSSIWPPFPATPAATKNRRPRNLLESERDKLAAFQNLFWALLNSNEFIRPPKLRRDQLAGSPKRTRAMAAAVHHCNSAPTRMTSANTFNGTLPSFGHDDVIAPSFRKDSAPKGEFLCSVLDPHDQYEEDSAALPAILYAMLAGTRNRPPKT